MLLFFIIFGVIIFFVICIFFSKIVFHINTLEIHINNGKFQYNINAKLSFYVLGKLRIFSIKVNNEYIEKMLKRNKKINISNIVSTSNKYKKFKNFKYSKLQIQNTHLNILIDTEDICVTAILVGAVSAVILNLIRNNIVFNFKTDEIKIVPIYNMNNSIDVFLKCDIVLGIKELI